MSAYKIVTGKNGDRYMKDGKFVKKSSLPPEVWTQLKVNELKTDEDLNPVQNRKCIFCGAHSNMSRLLNGQTIPICESHYYSETTGATVQRMNQLASA